MFWLSLHCRSCLTRLDATLPFLEQARLTAWKTHDSFLSAILTHKGTLHDHKIVSWFGGCQGFHNGVSRISAFATRLLKPPAIRHERAQREWIPARNLFPLLGIHEGIEIGRASCRERV